MNPAEVAEKARVQLVAKQIKSAREAQKKGPSAEFLATQARFNDAQKPSSAAVAVQSPTGGKAPQATSETSVKFSPMTPEQQELLRLELAECQRSGRTPDSSRQQK